MPLKFNHSVLGYVFRPQYSPRMEFLSVCASLLITLDVSLFPGFIFGYLEGSNVASFPFSELLGKFALRGYSQPNFLYYLVADKHLLSQ